MRGRAWAIIGGRLGVSAALLWLVFRYVDLSEVLVRLSGLRPGWVILGLALTVLQVAVLAWRWRFTAARLGMELPLSTAVSEYYLGILLNQILPGGVLGDLSRAWRHARADAPGGSAVRAVVLERATAQVVMTLTALASVLWLPWAPVWARVSAGFLTVLVLAAVSVWLSRPVTAASDSLLGRLSADAHEAVFAGGALAPQLVSALLVVASYIGVFLIAARALGVESPLVAVLPLVAPVLMTMLIPVSIGGWGLREAAAAALWSLSGLTAEDGAAISVTYGLIVLVSAAPGILVLMRAGLVGRDRTARPPRG